RVRKLQDAGIIRGRVALVDPERLGLGLTVFAEVSASEQSADWQARFAEVIADIPEVMEAHQLAGSHDYALRIVVRDMAGFERIRSRITEAIPVRGLSASFALKRIKSETVLPIDTRSA
ncbi:Lrp/AsnC family transcriptional regulator, partial [Salipiger sp. HF18]|uniref:Lrp/AsnC family transcriptional regulator n=1 Tax=Salipiger sp. HF18 TaxID=2721557 RepID=UPI00142E0C02